MIAKVLDWLEPNQADAQLARQQRLLNMVLFGLAAPGALFGLAMLLLWILGTTPPTGAIAGLGVQPFYALSYWLGRKGKITQAAYIPVGAVFLAMVGGGFQLGIGHVTYIGFAMATLTASILINTGAGLLIAVLSTLANLAIGMLQVNGKLPAPFDPLSTVLADSIGLGLGMTVLIIFTGIYGAELKKALAVQQGLSTELQANQADLENQVRLRTSDLERRLMQIRTAAEISRAISALVEPAELLQKVVNLVQERFGLYYVGVFLIDPEGDEAVLAAGTGKPGQKMLAEGHKLSVGGSSMIGWATFHRQPRIALDAGQEAVRFNNPNLPLTRSELALPILSGRLSDFALSPGREPAAFAQNLDALPVQGDASIQQRCLGAITVQSTQPNAFDQDDITMLQAVADSLATALENARLYQQTQASLEEVRSLHRQYLSRVWAEVKRPNDTISYTFEADNPTPSAKGSSMIEVPLSLRDQVIGTLTIERDIESNVPGGDNPGPFFLSPEELSLVETVAGETAEALENARLLNETQQRSEQLRLLQEIASSAVSHIALDELLIDVSKRLLSGLDLMGCWFIFFDEDQKTGVLYTETSRAEKSLEARPKTRFSLADSPIINELLLAQKPVVIYDAQNHAGAPVFQGLIKARGAQSLIVTPLLSLGKTTGVIGMEISDERRVFNAEDLRLFEQLGLQISGAIDAVRIFEQAQQRAERERTITEITSKVRASTNVDVIMKTALQELAEKLHLSTGMIQMRGGTPFSTPNGGNHDG